MPKAGGPRVRLHQHARPSQPDVRGGRGRGAKIDNLSQLNNCGFQDSAKKQNECYAKPECKTGGCSYSFSNRLITEPQLVDGAMQQVPYKCESVAQCPKPSDCTGDCSVMCLGGGGQNCIGNKCTTDKGTATVSPKHAPRRGRLRRPLRHRRRAAPPGLGGTVPSSSASQTTPRLPKTPSTSKTRRRGNNESATRHAAAAEKGFDMARGKCVEGFKTTKATAERCPTIFANNNACCDEEGKGWVPSDKSLPSPKPTRPGYARWVP